MHLGDGRGRSTAINDNQLKDKNDGVVHGALLLGLVSGLVASRLPGLARKKTQKPLKCIFYKTGPGTQLAGIQVAANLYLNISECDISISRLAFQDPVQLVRVLL